MHIFGVHLDRKATMGNVENVRSEIEKAGRKSLFFNMNAADGEKRKTALDETALERLLLRDCFRG